MASLLLQLPYVNAIRRRAVRWIWIFPVLLIMVLPQIIGVATAGDVAWRILLSSHPAWLSIESPMLIMLGCIFMGLAGLARKAFLKP